MRFGLITVALAVVLLTTACEDSMTSVTEKANLVEKNVKAFKTMKAFKAYADSEGFDCQDVEPEPHSHGTPAIMPEVEEGHVPETKLLCWWSEPTSLNLDWVSGAVEIIVYAEKDEIIATNTRTLFWGP